MHHIFWVGFRRNGAGRAYDRRIVSPAFMVGRHPWSRANQRSNTAICLHRCLRFPSGVLLGFPASNPGTLRSRCRSMWFCRRILGRDRAAPSRPRITGTEPAQQGWSILIVQSVHPQGRTPIEGQFSIFKDRVPFRGVRGGAQSLSPAGVAGVRQWAEAASLTI